MISVGLPKRRHCRMVGWLFRDDRKREDDAATTIVEKKVG